MLSHYILYKMTVFYGRELKMAKNKVQFQEGYSLPDLFNDYGSEKQCEEVYLAGNGQMIYLSSLPLKILL